MCIIPERKCARLKKKYANEEHLAKQIFIIHSESGRVIGEDQLEHDVHFYKYVEVSDPFVKEAEYINEFYDIE